MAVRSRQLFATPMPAGTSNLLAYQVPADRVAIIRALWVTQSTAPATDVSLAIANWSGSQPAVALGRFSVPPLGVIRIEEDIILNPGAQLRVSWILPTAVGAINGFGSLLAGAPS